MSNKTALIVKSVSIRDGKIEITKRISKMQAVEAKEDIEQAVYA